MSGTSSGSKGLLWAIGCVVFLLLGGGVLIVLLAAGGFWLVSSEKKEPLPPSVVSTQIAEAALAEVERRQQQSPSETVVATIFPDATEVREDAVVGTGARADCGDQGQPVFVGDAQTRAAETVENTPIGTGERVNYDKLNKQLAAVQNETVKGSSTGIPVLPVNVPGSAQTGGGVTNVQQFVMAPGERYDLDLPGKVSSQVVSPQKGGVIKTSGGLISVPAGAVFRNTKVFVKQYTEPPRSVPASQAEATVIGPICDFGPQGLKFRKPVTIKLRYNAKAIPKGMTAKNVRVAYFDGEKWIPIQGNVDPVAQTVSIQAGELPGIALTTLALGTAFVTVVKIAIDNDSFHNAFDYFAGDPSTNKKAYEYVTPKNPTVREYATIIATPSSRQRGRYAGFRTAQELKSRFEQYRVGGNLSVVFMKGKSPLRPQYEIVDDWGHDWLKPDAYFKNGMKGDCKNIANAYCSVFRSMGFQAKCVDGQSKGDRHVWCELAIDGTAYYVDEGEMMLLSEARRKELCSKPTTMWDERRQENYRDGWWPKQRKVHDPYLK